jgi:ribosomal protein L11 methyltransferase
VGCGSGLLSIVSAGLWTNANVVATDISPQAINDTQHLCNEHGMQHRVRVIRSDGLNNEVIRNRAPYDLIICNLLAEPIIAWAPDMRAHLKADGVLLVSGILAWFAADVIATYQSLGFEVVHTITRSPWITLVLKF